MNELQIIVKQQQGKITTNFDEVKEALIEQMEIYKELEVTEDNKTERKKDIATLRKMIKAVNSKRIEVKKECLKPYEVFEKQASELVDIINQPIGILDSQVKEFEDKQRLQKITDINTYFDETITGYPELIDEIGLTTIYDNRWENAGASMKSIREDIKAKLDKIQADITLIKSMPSDKTEEALRLYWGDLDVAKAITMINRYEQQKKEIEQRIAEQRKKEQEEAIAREVERARQAEREAIEREKQAEQKAIEREKQARQEELDAMAIKKQDAEVEKRLYGIEATKEEFEQVEMYLNSLGILFERV
jgi:hypothetical protein